MDSESDQLAIDLLLNPPIDTEWQDESKQVYTVTILEKPTAADFL